MKKLNNRLEKLKPCLMCPECGGKLVFRSDEVECSQCLALYPIKGDKIYFKSLPTKSEDAQDKFKEKLKRLLGKYYYTIGVNILAPNFPFNYSREVENYLTLDEQIVVDIGSGNNRIHEQIICLDLFDYEAVDIVCDVDKLPFKKGSIDAFVTRSMLEHVPNPEAVVNQFYQMTRDGGIGLHLIPFLFPFHASPYDFHRYTNKGVGVLFNQWKIIHQSNRTGPISLLLNIVIEFFSILMSFGNNQIKALLYFAFCVLLFPIKYLDVFFVNRNRFMNLAPTILTVVKKNI